MGDIHPDQPVCTAQPAVVRYFSPTQRAVAIVEHPCGRPAFGAAECRLAVCQAHKVSLPNALPATIAVPLSMYRGLIEVEAGLNVKKKTNKKDTKSVHIGLK
jgi:hypothetical protein